MVTRKRSLRTWTSSPSRGAFSPMPTADRSMIFVLACQRQREYALAQLNVPTIQRHFKNNGYYTLAGGKVLHHSFSDRLAGDIDRSFGRYKGVRPKEMMNLPAGWSKAWDCPNWVIFNWRTKRPKPFKEKSKPFTFGRTFSSSGSISKRISSPTTQGPDDLHFSRINDYACAPDASNFRANENHPSRRPLSWFLSFGCPRIAENRQHNRRLMERSTPRRETTLGQARFGRVLHRSIHRRSLLVCRYFPTSRVPGFPIRRGLE